MILGMGLRTALALYVFSFIDGYYSAREENDGTAEYMTQNPRVAAALNFITLAFGYFHVEEKKLGTAFLAVTWITNRILRELPADNEFAVWFGLVMEVVAVGTAIHGYSIGQAHVQKFMEDIPPPVRPESSDAFSPAIPLSLGAAMGACYAGLILWVVLFPQQPPVPGIVTSRNGSQVYENAAYNMELAFPDAWDFDNSDS